MNFKDFKDHYQRYPLVKSAYFSLEKKPSYIRRLVSEWLKKGWLLELRRGIYIFNDRDSIGRAEHFYIANQLYEPSYVSLESALSYYQMIPEGVMQTTSVGTRKTAQFSNQLGTFKYFKIKPALFWGFLKLAIEESQALIASPEKALLDLIYLRKGSLSSGEEVLESLRLQNLQKLRVTKLLEAAKRFNNKKILHVAQELSTSLTTKSKKK